MKNVEIIALACAEAELPIEVEVDTFNGWKKKGRQVKKGEKSVFKASIWHPSKKKQEVSEDDTEEDKKMKSRGFYLRPAFFFTLEQTEELKEEPKNV